MLGAITPGTVGSIASGRLVLVDKVDQFAAYLIPLPDQPSTVMNTWDGRFNGAFKASPFVSIEPVSVETLSARNQHFIRTGEVLPATITPEPVKPARQRVRPEGQVAAVTEPASEPQVVGDFVVFTWQWRSPANKMSRYVSSQMKGFLYLDNDVFGGNHPETVRVRVR